MTAPVPPPRRLPLPRLLAVLLLAAALPACASVDRSVAISEAIVLPITVGEAGHVPAGALAEAMLRAGFSPEEIVAHGPEVHAALATSGGAQLRQDKVVAALFAIHAGDLYVTSRTRGTFKQDLGPASGHALVAKG